MPTLSFDLISMSTLTWITERARARVKNQTRPISLEEKQKEFIAAVRKRGNISR